MSIIFTKTGNHILIFVNIWLIMFPSLNLYSTKKKKASILLTVVPLAHSIVSSNI